jgi:hypothetical protein
VFVEYTEEAGFPGFGFPGQGNNPALRVRRRLPAEECNSQDQRMAVWDILNGVWKSKTEIPVKRSYAGWTDTIPGRAGAGSVVALSYRNSCVSREHSLCCWL